MTTVKLAKDAGGKRTGDTIEVADCAAQHLIETGYAEACATTEAEPKKRRRTRVGGEAGGASPAADAKTAG